MFRLITGDDGLVGLADRDLACGPEPEEPRPIQYRMQEVGAGDDVKTYAFMLWFNEDAERCRFCLPRDCTYQPTSSGVGTCKVERDGGLALGSGRPIPLAPPTPRRLGGH